MDGYYTMHVKMKRRTNGSRRIYKKWWAAEKLKHSIRRRSGWICELCKANAEWSIQNLFHIFVCFASDAFVAVDFFLHFCWSLCVCYFLLRHNWLCRVHTNKHTEVDMRILYLVFIYVCDNLWPKPFSDIPFCIVSHAQYTLVSMCLC